MASLVRAQDRFQIPLQVIEGGSGQFRGLVTETEQSVPPSYSFVTPRHILRTPAQTPVKVGMVIQTPLGEKYIVGDSGPSETYQGPLWRSYRLFVVTGRYSWKTRRKVIDPVTGLPRDDGMIDNGMIYAAVEALDREAFDRKVRASIEQSRFITGQSVKLDDELDGSKVVLADRQLGIIIGVVG